MSQEETGLVSVGRGSIVGGLAEPCVRVRAGPGQEQWDHTRSSVMTVGLGVHMGHPDREAVDVDRCSGQNFSWKKHAFRNQQTTGENSCWDGR